MKKFVLLLIPIFLLGVSFAQQPSAIHSVEPAVLMPNENLVVDGIPPVPLSVVEQASRYTEFRAAAIFDWHPKQREMLIGTRFGDTVQVHRVAAPGGARTQLTFYPDRVSGASYHPHVGDYFVFSKDIGGGEWFQLYRFDVASGNVTLLTDGKSRNLGARWSNKGDRIAYASTRRTRADLDFYVMDPSDKSTDKMILQNQGGGWEIGDWSPDDKTLLVDEEVSVNESYLWLVDVASGTKALITPKNGEKVAYSSIGFSADGKGIYVTSDKDNEFKRIAYIDLATKTPQYLTSYPYDVEEARLSHDRKLLAFVLNENGLSTLHVMPLTPTTPKKWSFSVHVGSKEMRLPKLPTGIIGNLRWHENDHDLAFSVSSSRSPSDAYSVDLDEGKLDRWTTSETGGVNTQVFPEPQLVKWKSFDSKEISGWLYMPPAKFTGKRPVIVNIHGGPEGQSRPGYIARNNYFVNDMGIAILYPNVRGSEGYGKTFIALDNGFKREESYKDIEELLKWIKQQPNLDGNKILITGGSYGGHMTLAVATRYNDMIACSVDIVGMSNLVTFLEHTEPYRRDLRRVEYGDERDPKMHDFLESIAPMNHVKNVTKPMMVVSGANDPRVPKSEADQMVAALKAQNTPVWYLVGKNEGHGFSKKANADFQFYSTVEFIQKYLLGGSTEDSAAK